MSMLRWTSRSSTNLAKELTRQGYEVVRPHGHPPLARARVLAAGNAKVTEGTQHADRDAQFRYINEEAAAFVSEGEPAISVDAKKKELVGDFQNGGQEWQPKGEPERVRVHDFIDEDLGKGHPLRDLRPQEQRGLGECGRHRRHRGVRGRVHPAVVGRHGQAPLPQRDEAAHHPRMSAARTATGCGHGRSTSPSSPKRPGSTSRCVALPAGDLEVDPRSSTACSAASSP